MLPARHRLVRSEDFRTASRGRRAAGDLIVIHATTTDAGAEQAPRVGFVVSKSVGNAVLRNRTKRRLRSLMAAQVTALPPGTRVVVRARPGAADATSADLDREVRSLLPRALMPGRSPRRRATSGRQGP